MTATNQLTNHTQAFAADGGLWADSGGGPGSAQDSNAPIEDPENRARRIDGNDRGFSLGKGTLNLSAAGLHLGMWVRSFQPSLTTLIKLKFGGGGTPDNNPRSEHHFDGTLYPKKGPWIRLWVDPNRTPELTSGSLNLAAVAWLGANFEMGNVSGTSPNCHIARMDYGTEGILIDNDGTFAEAETEDQANALEILNDGVLNGPVRIKSMTDTNFAIAASPLQPLAATDWIRLDIDNTDAADNGVDWTGGGWFLEGILLTVTGTEGTVNLGTGTLLSAPAITFNPSVVFPGSVVNSQPLDANGANLAGVSFSGALGTHAVSVDNLALVAGADFVSRGAGHAVDRGTVSVSVGEVWSATSSGYDAGAAGSPATTTNTGNEDIRVTVASGQTYTITVQSGSTVPSVKNDGPGTVNVVVPQVSLSITGHPTPDTTLVIHDFDGANNSLGTELQRFDPASATEIFTYASSKAGDQISIQMIPTPGTFKRDVRIVTLGANDALFEFDPEPETN